MGREVDSEPCGNSPRKPQPFNRAPDQISLHFTGRTEELARIKEIFDHVGGSVPIRCVIYGMHGCGKSQLTLYFAKEAFEQERYSYVFWISATSIGNLRKDFDKLFYLVHPADHSKSEQVNRQPIERRQAAQLWLEECDAKWLLILDNVKDGTVEFLQEYLPTKNANGNIIMTTRSKNRADLLKTVAGRGHQVFELHLPTVEDAVELLLRHTSEDLGGTRSSAEDIVKCVGCLPLAVAQAGAFMSQSKQGFDDLLALYQRSRTKVGFFDCAVPLLLIFLVEDAGLGRYLLQLRNQISWRNVFRSK
jgi:hypothetical protein